MEQKHSEFGIASFIISIVAAILTFFVIIVAGAMEVSTPGGMDEESVGVVVVGLSILAFLALSLIAFGLGIGGLFQKDRKKLFAVLGVVFSGVTLVATISLMIVGLTIG